MIAATPPRDRHGHGEDVVGEQRRGRDEPRHRPEIVLRDGVRAAAARIGEDRLAIRQPDEHQQPDDDRRDRERRSDSAARAEHREHEAAICSVAYATDEMASEDSTASAVFLFSRS